MHSIGKLLVSMSVMTAATQVVSAPAVQHVSGALNHAAVITILGSGFGTKATAAPLVWDDATSADISDKWDGAWPSTIATYNTNYHSPMRNIGLPHNHDTRYIAGDHYSPTPATAVPGGASGGGNVVVFKNINLRQPFNIYASWYQRLDNEWTFGASSNIKTFAYSVCCSPYQLPNDWYTAYGPPHPTSSSDRGSQWLITDDGKSLIWPDINGHGYWWGSAVNPTAGKWSKVEVAVKLTNQDSGYLQVHENGKLVVDYAGPTDRYSGTARTIGIGGWSLVKGPHNWRYFADIYLDTSLSRIVLANNAVLSKATIIENQIPSSWTDTVITATVNLGQFEPGQTAYLFVVDSTGAPSASGLPVSVGGGTASP
jgi:hypothetical protein